MEQINNILLVTSLYPTFSEDNRSTPVCHFFARDWIKLGYNVVVIHIQPEYPWYTRLLINLRTRFTGIIPGGGYYYKNRLKGIRFYEKDEVPIYRIPLRKIVPRMKFSQKTLDGLATIVNNELEKRSFRPDIITGHMIQLDIVPVLNKRFHTKTCFVSHGAGAEIKYKYSNYEDLINSYSILGFRSKGIKQQFEDLYGKKMNSFICYSGIPSEYISANEQRSLNNPITSFLFVGDFIQRKYPDVLVEALHQVFPDNGFSLSFVGDGPLREYLQKQVTLYNMQTEVVFYGRIPRGKICEIYDKADVFVMISYGEAFGLVYLEAMARGCITIAAKNEGIDGIIIDGENGFLCEAGNVEQLVYTIRRINNMSISERQLISENAIKTAKNYTDIEAARMYANDLTKA